MKNDIQPCVVYARYSSHAQNDASIEQQVADIEVFCRQNNLQIVKVYADRHLTGRNDSRPQFQQMLKDAAHGRWRYVVTWKVDRFARNRYDSAVYKYRLKRYGVQVLYAKETIPEGPEGILLESVLEGSAEYYSANLSQNIKRGMHYNALECKVNHGSMPFGYCKGEDGRYAVKENEAEIVREIFRKVADGVPFVELANDLNGRGIHTNSNKGGGVWNKNSFRRMLNNENYIGVYHYADVRIEGGVPAIIDKALYLEVQEKLVTKKKPQGRHRENGEYMLTGKLFCGECGSPMVGLSGTGRNGLHYYYTCQGRRCGDCKKKNVVRDWIEQVVVDATLSVVLRDDFIQWAADQVMAFQERESNSAQLTALRDELADTQKSLNNMVRAIEAGIITASTKRRLQELEAEVSRIKDAITLEEASITHIERDFIVYWMESFRNGDRESLAFRRKVINTFVAAVYLWDDRIRIAFNYSGSRNTVEREIVTDAETVAGDEGSYSLCSAPPRQKNTEGHVSPQARPH